MSISRGNEVKQVSAPKNRRPYQKVADQIEERIHRGQYAPKQMLPSIKELSVEMKRNHLTVRRALLELQRKGLVEIRPRVGTFVTGDLKRTDFLRYALIFPDYFSLDTHTAVAGAFMSGAYAWCNSERHAVQTFFFHRLQFQQELKAPLLEGQFHGVCVVGRALRREDMQFLDEHGIANVQCGYEALQEGRGGSVSLDILAGMNQAVEHLRWLGHERICFLNYQSKSENLFDQKIREVVFNHRLGRLGDALIHVNNPSVIPHWEEVEKVFDRKPRMTAVVASDEFLVSALEQSCEHHGLSIPEDISVVGLQDLFPFYRRIPLTVVYGPEDFRQLVGRAFKLLDALVAGDEKVERHQSYRAPLKMKASTARPRP
jgi:DNA-binding LacI/PurR family transcriptional regulator